MKKGIILWVALCALASFANAAIATTTKKKTLKKPAQAVSATSKTAAKTTPPKGTPKPRTAASKTTKGKRTVRRTANHPRQLAPTKERYQQIQQALASKGYFSGEPTGVWGSDSVEGLKRFQADQNLTPDGKLTSLSLIALGLGPKRLSAQSPAPPVHANQQQ